MTAENFRQFISFLLKEGYRIFAPVMQGGLRVSRRIFDPKRVVLDGQVTYYSWRKYFLAASETLFNIHGDVLKKIKFSKRQVLIGPTILDLKALDLYNQVFKDDAYYQERKRNTIIIGQALAPKDERELVEFQGRFEENILEHVQFDIFLEKRNGKVKIITGSEDGQKLLEKFGYRDYENVAYAGPLQEGKIDEEMLAIKEKMEKSYNTALWKDLGARCIDCGKCTLVCPTCYCFRMIDEEKVQSGEARRKREWDTCFFPEFSRIAGGYKFLNSTEKRIYFWYEHKFVRDPAMYNMRGCVGCGRCTAACPVGINIKENIECIKE